MPKEARRKILNGNLCPPDLPFLCPSLIEKGYIQIRQGKTPNGGDYSEGHYLDKNHNYTSSENADVLIIREFRNDGTLVYETSMRRN